MACFQSLQCVTKEDFRNEQKIEDMKLKKVIIFIFVFLISTWLMGTVSLDDIINDSVISNDSLFVLLSQWNNYQPADSTGVFLQKENVINVILIL